MPSQLPWRRHRRFVPLLALVMGALTLTVAVGRADEKPQATDSAGGHWQTPGEIQQPKGTWQVPGEIQEPGEIQKVVERCRERLVVAADALFEFDQATLSPQAEATLAQLQTALAGQKGKLSVEGHTDSKGSDAYNQKLSEQRAAAVRDWLASHKLTPAGATIVGYGARRPVAPNRKPDGSDDPEGRAKNRRVEIAIDTCEKH